MKHTFKCVSIDFIGAGCLNTRCWGECECGIRILKCCRCRNKLSSVKVFNKRLWKVLLWSKRNLYLVNVCACISVCNIYTVKTYAFPVFSIITWVLAFQGPEGCYRKGGVSHVVLWCKWGLMPETRSPSSAGSRLSPLLFTSLQLRKTSMRILGADAVGTGFYKRMIFVGNVTTRGYDLFHTVWDLKSELLFIFTLTALLCSCVIHIYSMHRCLHGSVGGCRAMERDKKTKRWEILTFLFLTQFLLCFI